VYNLNLPETTLKQFTYSFSINRMWRVTVLVRAQNPDIGGLSCIGSASIQPSAWPKKEENKDWFQDTSSS